VKSELVHICSREPARSLCFTNAERRERIVDVRAYDVEFPVSSAILRFDRINVVRRERSNLLLGFPPGSYFRALSGPDRTSRDSPRSAVIDSIGPLLEKVSRLSLWWAVPKKEAGAPQRAPVHMSAVADGPTIHTRRLCAIAPKDEPRRPPPPPPTQR